LVNNAGYGLVSTVENVTGKEMREQFDINVFGLLRITKEIIPSMS
jgi:short-subunit dehydrogenase